MEMNFWNKVLKNFKRITTDLTNYLDLNHTSLIKARWGRLKRIKKLFQDFGAYDIFCFRQSRNRTYFLQTYVLHIKKSYKKQLPNLLEWSKFTNEIFWNVS